MSAKKDVKLEDLTIEAIQAQQGSNGEKPTTNKVAKVKPTKKTSAEKPKPTVVISSAKPAAPANTGATRIITSLDWATGPIQGFFTKVVAHYKPHLDEILSFMLMLDEAGREIFPNIFPSGQFEYDSVEWRRDNPLKNEWKSRPECLFLGLGGSPFDDHFTKDRSEASCTLVAKTIGTGRCPWTIKSLIDTAYEDRNGGTRDGDIAHLIKMLYRNGGDDVQAVKDTIGFGMMAINAEWEFLKKEWAEFARRLTNEKVLWDSWYSYLESLGGSLNTSKVRGYLEVNGASEEDATWFGEMIKIADNYERQAKHEAKRLLDEAIYYPIEYNGEIVYICCLTSNNLEVSKVCWQHEGKRVILLVHRFQKTGHVDIKSNRKMKIDLYFAGQKLQNNERQPGADWHVDMKGRYIQNGNPERFTDVKPTMKPVEDIVRFLQTQFDDEGRTRMGKRRSELPRIA